MNRAATMQSEAMGRSGADKPRRDDAERSDGEEWGECAALAQLTAVPTQSGC
jgi:hypothetical protein